MTEQIGQQLCMHTVTIEDMVPQNHFLRKVEAVVDFRFIYGKVREQDPRLRNGAEECTYTCWDCEKRYTCERCVLT